MAINKNHEFEELDGVKCSIVERNASQERVNFLKPLLEFNKYTVVLVPTPVKPAPANPAAATAAANATAPADSATPTDSAAPAAALPPPPPATFTIGVTNVMFNVTNAIFGRLLKAPGGSVVTLAYWQQKEARPDDETPYFAKTLA